MNHIKIRLIGATIVALLLFLGAFMTNKWVTAIIGASASALFLFLNPILDFIDTQKIKRQNKIRISSILEKFERFARNYLNKDIDKEKITEDILNREAEITVDNLFEYCVDTVFHRKSSAERKIIFVFSLCYEIENEKNAIKAARYRSLISQMTEDYNFHKMDSNSRAFLNAYYNFKQHNYLFGKNNDTIDFYELALDFTKQYCKTQNLAIQLFMKKEQVEEFYRTLSFLILRGKLSVPLLKDRVERGLKKVAARSRAYILLINKFQRLPSIEKSLNKFPQIKIGRLQPIRFPMETKYLHMRIVYPEVKYANPADFLHEEIVKKIPKKEKNNGFVAIIPIEGTDIISYPKNKDSLSSDNLKKGFEAIYHIKTGIPQDTLEIIVDTIKSEMSLPEILSVIPFNIFVPELDENARIFLIKRYRKIQNYFKIKTLFDWCDVKPTDLAKKIISLPDSNILKEEEWEKIAEKICLEAQKHTEAVMNLRKQKNQPI